MRIGPFVVMCWRDADEMLWWALDACDQATDGYKSGPGWHYFMSTWEQAEDVLPRFARAIGVPRGTRVNP